MLASSSNTQDGHLFYLPFSWVSSHVCHIVPSFADSLLNLGVLPLYPECSGIPFSLSIWTEDNPTRSSDGLLALWVMGARSRCDETVQARRSGSGSVLSIQNDGQF